MKAKRQKDAVDQEVNRKDPPRGIFALEYRKYF
jgi:hypothetical protein